ncbi:glycosyltransferase family 4 protein [uncultured Arcanobacterium sp.]|uniref:glycosyltransferase family 4 protein n=1 Tax=uncultured Arcanobacterium sp. TaxID=487520 RepID=UPI0026025210|nr:glycosyltransferase family 4 protein [uncultured Arcanobacterium sp.]
MRIGIACGYSWDVAGGVQIHIRDLAQELIAQGHEVQVIAPAENPENLEPFLTSVGGAIPIRYNGSVARLAFGPKVNLAVRNWLREGNFDVLHVHEPFTPSVSMLALMNAKCPVVSTFHTAMDKSRIFSLSAPLLVPILDKITARIAVSQEARRTAVQYLGGDAWIIPNGVKVENLQITAPDPRFAGDPDQPVLAFLGRLDEPRKGLPVVAAAFPEILSRYPGARLLVAGRGNIEQGKQLFGSYASSVKFLGGISDADKAALLGSADIYLAPNTGGESFGIILVEAMSAGACIVASDIPAFRAVLEDGKYGFHFRNEDAADLAAVVNKALANPQQRQEISARAAQGAWKYDWGSVAKRIFHVYETAIKIYQTEVD